MGARRVGPRRVGAPKGGGPEGWGAQTQKTWSPEGWGPRRWGPKGGGPKILRFFFPLQLHFRSFCLSLGSSRGILVVFEVRDAQMCAFGVLWLSCEAPAAPKPPGLHTTAREPKSAHFRGPTPTLRVFAGPSRYLFFFGFFLLCSSWKEEGRTRLYHQFGSKKVWPKSAN